MRKLLYGTSALVAAGLLQADPAFAQAKESPVTLTVGGRFHAFYAYIDQDEDQLATGPDRRNHFLSREAEILFRGRTALNNGLRAGVHVGLEAEVCSDQIDESYIWFEHDSFGRAEIGSTDQVGWKMFYGAPNAIPNFSTAQLNMRAYNVGAGINAAAGSPQALLNLGNDGEHINYFTPRFFGFQVGLSYQGDVCEENNANGANFACGGSTHAAQLEDVSGRYDDLWEVALNFVQKFGDFNVGVYGAYNHADLQASSATANKNQYQYGFGAQVGFYGFAVGAHYKYDNLGFKNADYKSWGAGVSYHWDAWKIGLEFGTVTADNVVGGTGVVGSDRTWNASLGVQYSGIGPGINLWGGALMFDQRDGNPGLNAGAGACGGVAGTCTGDSNDGIVFVLGTTVTY